MAKQLNVNLAFNADTAKAKAAIEDLNSSLQKIQSTPRDGGLVDDVSIRRASEAARELQKHLSAAVNVDTGKIDLNRFSHSLKSSGKDLKAYYADLSKIGPAGEQAFLKLSRSIATAETSTVRVNKKMQEFATTLKNTARWQISSSVLHGLMGAVQSAYGYAKDLDASLNDIRIVTGASADEMDKFAVKANHAAKALSTSTTEYAKASLIYFQQGLSDSQVEERTAITIKMANAAGQSAETISDQLTAVWNNFYDGSQSLEHYADAMVRLGADTASSSDEIAEGLEKFASIGPMIGLGFDEAASALATVTAQTRQSADVVGTAYKTIFARIQGLNLGETLDDGTTLNKYSEALAKVGINIKDQYGSIKDMNVIIEEMGAKWQTIDKDQQIALAQAVGGVRQYNQIVALMDNFDIYKENLNSAKNADGSLDVQAEIYAESWEAAEARVQAAAEGVYDSLLNEDFFIGFDNGISVLLEGVEGLVDGLGGMTGVIATIGSLMMRHFAKEVPGALKNLRDNIHGLLGKESADSKQVQSDNDEILDNMNTSNPANKSQNAAIEGAKTLNAMNHQLNEGLKNLSQEERRAYEEKIKSVELAYEMLEATGKELEQEEKKTAELEKQLIKQAAQKQMLDEARKEAEDEIGPKGEDESQKDYDKRVKDKTEENLKKKRQKTEKTKGQGGRKESRQSQAEKDIAKQTKELKKLITQTEKYERIQRNAQKQAKSWKENADAIKRNVDEAKGFRESIKAAVDKMGGISKESKAYKDLSTLLENNCTDVDALIEAFENLSNSSQAFRPINTELKKLDAQVEAVENELSSLGMDGTGIDALEEEFRSGAQGAYDFEESLQTVSDGATELPQHVTQTSEALAELGSGMMGLVGVASGMEGLFDVFSDENASAIQKVGAVIGFLSTMITAATGVYRGLKAAEEAELLVKLKNKAATIGSAIAAGVSAVAQHGLAAGFKATIAPIIASGAALKAHPIMWIVTIIMAVVMGVAALCSALEKSKEKHAEDAKASKENADAIYEEVQANNELVESFNQAIQKYKEGKGSKEDIAEATKALCAVYDIENAELLLAAENYDALAESIRNAEQAKLSQAKAETSLAVADAKQVFEDQMRDGTGHFSGGDYIAKIGGGASDGDEAEIKDAINTMVKAGDLNGDIISHDGNDINLNTGQTTEDLIEAYEEMQKLQAYLAQNVDQEVLAESENYQNLVDWLAKSQESYTDLIALQGQLEDVSVQAAKNTIVAKHGEIETMEQYKQAEDELTQSLLADKELNLDAEEARELAQAALASEEAYAQMAKDSQIIEQASEATNGNISSEQLLEFFNGLSEDERTLFATLNFESATSIENLEEQLGVLQARADRASVKTNLEAVEGAQSQLKDDMSAEDYKNFETESGLNWGEDGIVEYSDFLRMTYEEQSEYLSQLNDQYSSELEESTDALIAANEERIAAINEQLPEVQAQVDELAAGLTEGLAEDNTLLVDAQGLNESSATYQTDLQNLANEYGVSAEDIQSYLDAYNNAVSLTNEVDALGNEIEDLNEEEEINDILDFAQTKEDLLELQKELAGLEAGDTISADQYKLLAEQLPHLANSFIETADGSYQLAAGLDTMNMSWRDMAALKDENGEAYFNPEDIANMITNIGDLNAALAEGAITAEQYTARFEELSQDAAASATSLSELDAVVDQFQLGENDEAYTQNLIRIAEGYESCADELKDYQAALSNFSLDESNEEAKEALEAAEDNLRAIMTLEEGAEKYGLEVETLTAQSKRLAKAYELNAEEAAQLAIRDQRMNKGVSSLVDNWGDWKKQLKSSDKLTQDYADAIVDCTAAIADLVGASEDLELPDEFFNDENMKLIEKAMEGDTQAINQLGAAVAETTVEALEFNSSFADLINRLETWDGQVPDITLNTAQFDADKATVLAGIEDIKNGITTAGAAMDGEWVAALNRMALTTGMSVQEMNGLLGSLGVQAKVETTYVEQPMEVPTYIEHVVPQAPVTVQQGEDADGNPNMVTYTPVQKYSVPGKPMQVTGFAAVAQISTEDNPMTAQVTSNTVKGGSAPAASYSGNRGSVSPSATSGSGGGGGGGGGDTPEAKENVDHDPREHKKSGEETERYREINNLLENLARKLDKVSEAKNRAFGKNKIALMKEEAKLLREQIALEQQKQQEILANLQNDKSKIQNNYGATFDEEGNVNNYDEMVQAQVNKYNAAYDAYIKAQNDAVNAYNASSRDDAAEAQYDERIEAAERAWEDAQEAYDQFTEDLDQYDETYDLFEESQITLNDIQNQLYDLALEEVEYKVQLKLDIEDDQMKVLDFLLGNLEDNAHDAAEAIAILTQQTESAMNNLATYEQGINDIFANHGLGSNAVTQFLNGTLTADDLANMEFTEAEVEKLREYRDGLLDETQNLIDYENTIREKVLTAWDDLVSKMDQGIEKLDHLTSMTESYKNIVDIVGKDMLGISDELMKSLDQATYDTALNKLEATSSKLDAMRASRQDAEDALAQARLEGNEDLVQYWEDTIATMDSEIDSAEEEFMISWEESLQAAADMFANETEAIINEFSEKMAGAFGGTLEELQNAFSKQREINDLYVDDYKKIYELSKLSRDISKSVDETDNLAGKKALLAIQEEINKKQAEGVEMSEYEIENLRRKYELELAKMQLDEAKNTKSTVRMTRDNNGNWGYVYTADQDGVAAAEQNYEDKLYAMQQANSDYIKELEANIIQAEIDMTEAMRAIDATQYANAEEYYKACEDAAKPYYEMMEFYTSQMNLALGNNKQLYNGDWKEYSISTGYKISANEDFMDSFSETLLGQMTGYRSAEGYLQAHIEAVGSVDNPESLLGKLGTAYSGYSAKVDAAMEAAGTSTKNFAEHLDGYVNDEENGIAANAEKASASVEQAGKDMKDAMDKVISDVSNFSSKYGNKIQAIISKNTQLANSLNSVIAKWSELNGEEDGGGTTTTTTTTPTSTPTTTPAATPTTPSTSGNTQSKSNSGDGSLSKGDVVTYTGGKYYADSYGGGASGSRGPGKKVTVTDIRDGRPYPIHVQSSDSAYGWLKKSQLSGFDTGGYTGVWGDQMGRLALLHQKELVLNENETKDMLQMIEMVREISSMIDLNAMSASQGLTGYLSSGRFNDGMMTIQQEVTIHAEFPDVSDRNEIKEAFGDLINMAAQYANRVK